LQEIENKATGRDLQEWLPSDTRSLHAPKENKKVKEIIEKETVHLPRWFPRGC